eukprot:Selendium_serpulae@DN7962_c0_g1_i1.p1
MATKVSPSCKTELREASSDDTLNFGVPVQEVPNRGITLSILLFFFATNFFLYVDRGIIPGASRDVAMFIVATTGSRSPDAIIGLLQGAFVAGATDARRTTVRFVN